MCIRWPHAGAANSKRAASGNTTIVDLLQADPWPGVAVVRSTYQQHDRALAEIEACSSRRSHSPDDCITGMVVPGLSQT